jgi:biotin operon repressor
MKRQHNGHRWTDEEIKTLMAEWAENTDISIIAATLNVTCNALLKMITRLRANGIPLKRRQAGHIAGRRNQPWTQEEVEYLVRRREEQATVEVIANELCRSLNGVNGMIQKMRQEGVAVKMLGCGVRRLWSSEKLRESAVGRLLIRDAEKPQSLRLVS